MTPLSEQFSALAGKAQTPIALIRPAAERRLGEFVSRHAAKIAEGLRLLEAQGWKPIETAPRNGAWIILGYFLEAGGGGDPQFAFWSDTRKLWCGHGGYLNAGGYFSPTHWLPMETLPPDPRLSPAEGG